MAFTLKQSPNRPSGRPAKFPSEKVVEMLRQGMEPEEIADLSGLSASRVKEIRCKAGLGPGLGHNKGKSLKKEPAPPIQRPGFMVPAEYPTSECIVRQGTPEELAEIERMLLERRR